MTIEDAETSSGADEAPLLLEYKPLGPERLAAVARNRPWDYFTKKSPTGFVGLSNQGATCYMNSLLQTLFMTPEFRSALYRWSYDEEKDGPKEECIPYQLQKLFAHLELTERAFVGTKGLTKSFGWSAHDSFEQHDIQELNRVLMDALENSFRGTPQEDFINELYEGMMVDELVCQECKNVVSRDDKYLDIPLVIRDVDSMYEALDKFVEVELLDGDNKYFCEKCDKKCAATKGMSIKGFPYVLTLQLKRFDIDFERFERIKLNNKVTFPRYADLSEWVDPERQREKDAQTLQRIRQQQERALGGEAEDSASEEDEEEEGEEMGDMATLGSDDEDETQASSQSYLGTARSASKDKDAVKEEEPLDDTVPPEGEHVYELYSILIHSGSANGGHYYAYIKSFSTRKWYKFNDSTVTPLKKGDIEKSFGGSCSKSYWGSSASNAYMLVYRRVGNRPEKLAQEGIEVPESLRKEIESENSEYVAEKQAYKIEKNKLNVKVYHNGCSVSFDISRLDTLRGFTESVYERFQPECLLEDFRLRHYDPMAKLAMNDFGNNQDQLIKELGVGAGSYITETREVGAEWPAWSEFEMTVRVTLWNDSISDFEEEVLVKTSKKATLGEFKETLGEQFGIEPSELRVFDLQNRIFEMTEDDSILRKNLRIFDGDTIAIERRSEKVLESGERYSAVVDHVSKTRDVITVHYNIPGTTKYDQSLELNRNTSLLEVKKQLAEITGLDLEEFKLKRRYNSVSEFKDLTASLRDSTIHDNGSIHIELGAPLQKDEHIMKFSLYCPGEQVTIQHACELPVSENWTFQQVKELLSPKVDIPVELIRLRDRFGTRLAKIFRPHHLINKAIPCLYDGREVLIQELSEPDQLEDDELVLLVCQYFNNGDQLTSGVEEMKVKKMATLWDLQSALVQHSGIPMEHLCLAKPVSSQTSLTRHMLTSLSWKKSLPQEEADMKLSHFMWFISDGDRFIYKDLRDEPETTDADLATHFTSTMASTSSASTASRGSSVSSGWSRSRRPEKALKILSRSDKDKARKAAEEAEAANEEEPSQEQREDGSEEAVEVEVDP